MAYTEPTNRSTGYGVTANDWNVFVENDKDFQSRVSSLETNQGTRGSNGAIYTEINSIKSLNTTQNTRLSALESDVDGAQSDIEDLASTVSSHGSRLTAVETKNTQQDNRITALEDGGGGGGGSGTPAFFKAWISDASKQVVAGSTGLNFQPTASGFSFVEQGGFTVSGEQIFLPSDGIYLVVCQVVFDNLGGTSNSVFGMYATLGGMSGAVNSLCAQEVQYDGNQRFAVAQISSTAPLSGTDYLGYRLYSAVNRNVRGTGHTTPYGGTFITITRLGGIA